MAGSVLETPKSGAEPIHERFDWLDQSRGVIVVFLLISMITYPLSGKFVDKETMQFGVIEPVLGPTWLNHGGKYLDAIPQMITFIDSGQQVFMFLMGFVAFIAFTSRLRKRGGRSAWTYALRRVGLLYLLSFLQMGLAPHLMGKDIDWRYVVWLGTFANLAFGALAGYMAMYLVPRAEKRIWVAIAIMVGHALAYGSGWFDRWGYWVDPPLPQIPFRTINHASVAILGTCFSEWVFRDKNNLRTGFVNRVLPGAALMLAGAYAMDWIQPCEPHDVTTAHVLLSTAIALFMIGGFYAFAQIGFTIPPLDKLGKNMILMFILAFIIVDLYVALYSKEWLLDHRVLAMLLVGVAPIAVLYGIAHLLHKKGIVFRL